MTAQGNALGYGVRRILSPEGAAYAVVRPPFQGSIMDNMITQGAALG
jgi:hypothetical protein